ncbi:uncharacterized protein EV420DRAFT_1486063 [Desarmillaria tabescens]|uniref:Uncharacterized protein n=1 Tax=Armillaria tabescens TaxID=1929756 RepID=A0AA39JDN9_ARMTA|nr:uncharacterized protein EV420DRAFT_1486063 [Desarmillaria tabescens]KAK0440040.1 hypothetical protein EV420DRAFT_1486063 [Desarmillaria tabescens]
MSGTAIPLKARLSYKEQMNVCPTQTLLQQKAGKVHLIYYHLFANENNDEVFKEPYRRQLTFEDDRPVETAYVVCINGGCTFFSPRLAFTEVQLRPMDTDSLFLSTVSRSAMRKEEKSGRRSEKEESLSKFYRYQPAPQASINTFYNCGEAARYSGIYLKGLLQRCHLHDCGVRKVPSCVNKIVFSPFEIILITTVNSKHWLKWKMWRAHLDSAYVANLFDFQGRIGTTFESKSVTNNNGWRLLHRMNALTS